MTFQTMVQRWYPRRWLVLMSILMVLPWLNPFTPAPSPSTGPLLVSWTCMALVLLLLAWRGSAQSSDETVCVVALAWVIAATLNAFIGWMQYVGWSAHFGIWFDHYGPGEAIGNVRQRNQFATLMSIGLVALCWWANRMKSEAATYLLALAAVLMSIGNVASSSRTGLTQWVLLALVIWVWSRRTAPVNARRVQRVLVGALLGYCVATFVLPWSIGIDPLNSTAAARLGAGDSACGSRLTLWGNVLHLIGLKPWFGWGWGELGYAHFITLYPATRFCDMLDNAHNLPLHLAVELGVPLAILMCGTALWLVWRGRPWQEIDPTRQMAWLVLAVIGLHSMLEYPIWYGQFQLASLACIGLLCWPVLSRNLSLTRLRLDLLLSGGLILGLCALATYEYRIVRQIYLPYSQRAPAMRDNTIQIIQQSWLYSDLAQFAMLMLLHVDAENAKWARIMALKLLHYSSEVRVVRVLLEADQLLGLHEEYAFYAERFRAAFPDDYARWKAASWP